MDLTVIVVSYNTGHLLEEAFAALERAAHGLQVHCIVVDNASRDGSVELLKRRFPHFRLIENRENVGFGRANNQALPHVRGRYVLLLNADAFVAPEALRNSIAYLEANPRCGVLGARLEGRDGVLQPSCRYFPTPWNLFLQRTGLAALLPRARVVDDMAWDHAEARSCDWVPGCYYVVRKAVIDRVGLFDPRFFLYYEEVDHCRAVKRAGWEVVFHPGSRVVHVGGESTKSDHALTTGGRQAQALMQESELLYLRKHHGLAGVIAHVLLCALAQAMSALRHRARGTRLPWSALRRTRLGAVPAR